MIRYLTPAQLLNRAQRRQQRLAEAEKEVAPIIEAVEKRGDDAVLEFAKKFDKLDRQSPHVSPAELEAAAKRLSKEFIAACKTAATNIRSFARFQMPREVFRVFQNGIRLGQIIRPLERVACYVPGGRYPLPSTLLMTVLPAQVARVPEIYVSTPSTADEIWGLAHLLKVTGLFQLGGAHAIAAFAFGTKTIPKVDRIVGPGSIYVAAAKRLLAGVVGIDFVAGPTEVLIIADSGNPRWIAADMLAQAEHDVEATAILITPSRKLADHVIEELQEQLKDLPTAPVAREALRKNGAIVFVKDLKEAIALANEIAPEHLVLHEPDLLSEVKNAGSVFLGPTSPEAAGDYASGPNHVLPTSGLARIRGGLSIMDYVKVITVQQLTPQALAHLAPTIITLARAEGLEAHARSIEVRTHG